MSLTTTLLITLTVLSNVLTKPTEIKHKSQIILRNNQPLKSQLKSDEIHEIYHVKPRVHTAGLLPHNHIRNSNKNVARLNNKRQIVAREIESPDLLAAVRDLIEAVDVELKRKEKFRHDFNPNCPDCQNNEEPKLQRVGRDLYSQHRLRYHRNAGHFNWEMDDAPKENELHQNVETLKIFSDEIERRARLNKLVY